MTQLSFDPLILTDQDPFLALVKATEIMRRERDAQARRIRSEGIRCKGWALRSQVRPYRGLGQPDGSIRTVFMLNVYQAD